jgi:hypothetical protein
MPLFGGDGPENDEPDVLPAKRRETSHRISLQERALRKKRLTLHFPRADETEVLTLCLRL